jgi:hypothetical protein
MVASLGLGTSGSRPEASLPSEVAALTGGRSVGWWCSPLDGDSGLTQLDRLDSLRRGRAVTEVTDAGFIGNRLTCTVTEVTEVTDLSRSGTDPAGNTPRPAQPSRRGRTPPTAGRRGRRAECAPKGGTARCRARCLCWSEHCGSVDTSGLKIRPVCVRVAPGAPRLTTQDRPLTWSTRSGTDPALSPVSGHRGRRRTSSRMTSQSDDGCDQERPRLASKRPHTAGSDNGPPAEPGAPSPASQTSPSSHNCPPPAPGHHQHPHPAE